MGIDLHLQHRDFQLFLGELIDVLFLNQLIDLGDHVIKRVGQDANLVCPAGAERDIELSALHQLHRQRQTAKGLGNVF